MTDYKKELAEVEEDLSVLEVELQELLERQNVLINKRTELKLILENCELKKDKNKNIQWEGTAFPWTADLDEKLTLVFKLSELRAMQRQTMNATLAKEDCLLIMPTGGGKSLCFQLPAVIDKGLTLVISPLVSLMEDQQMALEQLGIPSAIFTAATSKEESKQIQEDMLNKNGHLKLLYVTPEKLAKSKRFMNRLEKCFSLHHLDRIVIDEVHCCSQWGHDFRPDYKFLGILKRQFPKVPLLGLTATATFNVLEDVKKILNIPRALLFRTSFNRANLFYEVQKKPATHKETMDKIYQLIKHRFKGQSGIIYCFSRKDSEEVTADLTSRGIKAGYYHADVAAQSRSMVHRKWLSGEIQIVVATVAFGMGIDKPDVRFVIHHSISKSIENLYQESGRAGRDGQRSDCVVLYRLADVTKQSSMVFTEQTGLQNLYGIVKYCIDVKNCRRSLIARHFGEVWDSSHCDHMCDHCFRNQVEVVSKDISHYCKDVIAILDAASATQQRVTSAKLLEAWYGRGPSGLKVKSVAAPSLGKKQTERILAQMIIDDYLQEDFHFTAYSTICYIKPGPKAKLLRNNSVKVFLDFLKAKNGKSSVISSPANKKDTSSEPPIKSPTTEPNTNSNKIPASTSTKSRKEISVSDVRSRLEVSLQPKKIPNKDKHNLKEINILRRPLEGDKVMLCSDDAELNFDDADEGKSKERSFKMKSQIDYSVKLQLNKAESSKGVKRNHSEESDKQTNKRLKKKMGGSSSQSANVEKYLDDSITISDEDDFVT